MAETQEFVTFEGPLTNIFCTDKVIKFSLKDRHFIGWESSNRAVTLLKEIMTLDRTNTPTKVTMPIPVKKSIDKQNKLEQLILTNHTRIFLDDQLVFYPAEQQEDIALLDDAVKQAEEMAKEQENNDLIVMNQTKKLANQQAQPKQLNKSSIVKAGGFYNVNGKQIPDAPKIQEEINNLIETSGRTFNLFVIECDKNNDKAWAKVRVEDAITHQIIEDAVVHHYNTLADAFLLDMLNTYDKAIKNNKPANNPIISFDDQNKPILSPEARKNILVRTLKFKQFAERDAITKAASRAYLKILNREWREKEEIESELAEVELVNS